MSSDARTKGTALIQLVKTLRALPGARAHVPSHLLRYLDERVLATAWYPEIDYFGLFEATVAAVPKGTGDVWTAFGVQAAQHDLNTVYRALLRGADLPSAVRASRELFLIYHDGPRATVDVHPDHVQLDVLDYTTVSSAHCRFIDSYIREQLRLTLGRKVLVRQTMCTARGDDRCRREIRDPEGS